MTGVIIAIIIIVVIIKLGINGVKKQKQNTEKAKELGYLAEAKVITGKYLSGHPDLNAPILPTAIYSKDNKLEIVLDIPFSLPKKEAIIDNSTIKNVLAEDQTTIEKKVTVGRLLAVGVFAFALKKKKKTELAYLTIEWNDGRFDHDTIFEFEGAGAMQKANTARNQIMKFVR